MPFAPLKAITKNIVRISVWQENSNIEGWSLNRGRSLYIDVLLHLGTVRSLSRSALLSFFWLTCPTPGDGTVVGD